MKKRIILFFVAMIAVTGFMTAQHRHGTHRNDKGPYVDRYGTDNYHYDIYYGQDHHRHDRRCEGKHQKHLERLYRKYEKTERKAWRDGHLSHNELRKLQRLEQQIAQVSGTMTHREYRQGDRRWQRRDNRRDRSYGYHRPDRHQRGTGCH